MTIAELCLACARWAKGYYKSPDGRLTQSMDRVEGTIRLLRRKYGRDRAADIDRSGDVWQYRPALHKTAYRGHARVIFLGPQAQAVLLPYLLRDSASYCFCPAERVDKWSAQRRAELRSPMTPSQAKRHRKSRPATTPGEHYTNRSYAQVIRRTVSRYNAALKKAAKQAGREPEGLIPNWSPNQLRHTAATEIRKQFGGLEPLAAVLGHAHMQVSEVHAEKNLALAADCMRKIG